MRYTHPVRFERQRGLTPEMAARALAGAPGRFWLDADGVGEAGRYAFVGAWPDRIRRATPGQDPTRVFPMPATAFEGQSPIPLGRVPHWVGYFAYDAGFDLGGHGRTHHPRSATTAHLARYPAVLGWDLHTGDAFVISETDEARDRLLDAMRLAAPAPAGQLGAPSAPPAGEHIAAIDTLLEHIGAGDLYQANLARPWKAPFEGDPLALFESMRALSPVPFGFFLEAGREALVGRSMELFLRHDGPSGWVETRPIKGTVAREGDQPEAAAALVADEKERAEHAMIVDLMRNDLGRVVEVGTVKVAERFVAEPYAGLYHMVSSVVGRLGPERTHAELLAATFPPGSVTGAPKRAAMQWIDALEPGGRGPYCGAAGHVDRAGGLTLAVSIRTAVVREGEARYWAGGGIVEASQSEREVAETEVKAQVFVGAAAHEAPD